MTCEVCDSRNITVVSTSDGPIVHLTKTCRELECQHIETKKVQPNVDLQQMPSLGVEELHQY